MWKSILLLHSVFLLTDTKTKEEYAQRNSLSWTAPKWTTSRDFKQNQFTSFLCKNETSTCRDVKTLNHHPRPLQSCRQFKDHEDFFFLLSVPAPGGRSQHSLRSEVCTAASPLAAVGGSVQPYILGRGALFTHLIANWRTTWFNSRYSPSSAPLQYISTHCCRGALPNGRPG